MSRQIIITLRVNQEEKKLISELAGMLQRSRSDTIRFVLFQVLKKLEGKIDNLDFLRWSKGK